MPTANRVRRCAIDSWLRVTLRCVSSATSLSRASRCCIGTRHVVGGGVRYEGGQARVATGWSMNTDTMGVYGNYYLKRAIVTQLGLGANLPEDAIYPLNLFDDTGKPLDGANKYTIHFDKGGTPPVNAFWSITLYDSEGFQVANALNRFAVSSWMPFKTNPDGSLDLYFQNGSPGKNKEANWLPAPKEDFNLCMRLYGPESEALTGKWNPPVVTKVQEVPTLL